jgi:hypothetical protein
MFKEIAVILYDDIYPVTWSFGTAGRVDFDLERWFEFRKNIKDVTRYKFIHTHPEGYIDYSPEDYTLMKAIAASIAPESFRFDIFTKSSYLSYQVSMESLNEWKERKAKGDVSERRLVIKLTDVYEWGMKNTKYPSWIECNNLLRSMIRMSYD